MDEDNNNQILRIREMKEKQLTTISNTVKLRSSNTRIPLTLILKAKIKKNCIDKRKI